jgi:hypothetical protein
VLSVLFTAAWWALPGFRAWLEQPKHRFQEQVRRYDRERSREGGAPGGRGT